MNLLVLPFCALGLAAEPELVEIEGETWRALMGEIEREPPGPWAAERSVRLELTPAGVRLRATWSLRSVKPGMFTGPLVSAAALVERASWNGRQAALVLGEDGWSIHGAVDGRATVTVDAFFPGSSAAGMQLELLPAVSGDVEVSGADATVMLSAADRPVLRSGARWTTGAGSLQLAPAPPRADAAHTLVVARVGMGITIGDADLQGQASIRWEVRRGALERLAFRWSGRTDDLVVEGPGVRRWHANGDRIEIEFDAPVDAVAQVRLRWSESLPDRDEVGIEIPQLSPEGAFRTDGSLQIARDGDRDLHPALEGWDAIPPGAVPPWGAGLVVGTTTATYRRTAARADGAKRIETVRFLPVSGPSLVVDVADYAMAVSEEGRVLARARYQVTNRQAAHLSIEPPPGFRPIAVEVAGKLVRPARDGTVWRIPLERSTETVEGLMTVPVVVGFIGQSSALERRTRADLALPVLDAPTTVTRVSLHLPRGWRSRLRPGDGTVVEAFTRGHDVHYGFDDDLRRAQEADALQTRAVEAWNRNEFEQAQRDLDALAAMGARSSNADKLQSNLEAVLGPKAAEGEPDSPKSPATGKSTAQREVASRRVRAMARARATTKREEQRQRKQKAKSLEAAGDYAAAAEEYERALEVTRDLRRLDDAESVVYDFEDDEIQGALENVEAAAATRQRLEQQDDGEHDFVSIDPVELERLGELPPTPEPRPTEVSLPRVIVPIVGETVRHQMLLLQAGARRTIRIDARRRARL